MANVSRAWRKVKVDWDAWSTRSLAEEDIVLLILDGTVIKTRLDRKATNISVLPAIGVRRDGQKVLLSIKNMGGESTAAWGKFLADLDGRGLKRPEFVIVDGAPGLEAALVALWGDQLPIQRCTVHKHRNLLAHAPKHLHDELADNSSGIDAENDILARFPETPVIRNPAGAAAVTAMTATAALASGTEVTEVNVTADVTAITNGRAAAFWANIAPDLEGAILARPVDRLADDGATITVDIRELALADAFERAFSLEDAVLGGQVNVSHPTDNTAFDSYEPSLSLEGGQLIDTAGQVIVVTGIDAPEAYATLVERFAQGVVERPD
jgi:hypothetical protein